MRKTVSDKLSDLVGQGVSSIAEMKRHLRVYVKDTLFRDQPPPAITDSGYFPNDNILRKHIYMEQLKLRLVIAMYGNVVKFWYQ